MSSGYYKQNAEARDTLYLALSLAHDVELTIFGDDGRDHTFKARANDFLVFQQAEDGDWFPTESYPPDELCDSYDLVGDV